VEVVKDTEQLQKNLIRCVGAESIKMHEVYNRVPVQIALTIRELEGMRAYGGSVMDVLKLDSLKLLVEEEHEHLQQTITELIARRSITPSMGFSLVNDSVFAHDIAVNLIRAAQFVFATADAEFVQAAQDVVLDKFNAQTTEYGDMIELGILDPTKVVRVAVQNAASIAGLMITTEAMIAELPKKEARSSPQGRYS
jgi:hypothetical protein